MPTGTLEERLVTALEKEKNYIRDIKVLYVTEYKGRKISLFLYKLDTDYEEVRFFEDDGITVTVTSGVGGNPVSPGAQMFTVSGAGPYLANGNEFGIVYGQILSPNITKLEVTFLDGNKVFHDVNKKKGYIVAYESDSEEEREPWWVGKISAFDDRQNLIYSFPIE